MNYCFPVNLSHPMIFEKTEEFLSSNGLQYEPLDVLYVVANESYEWIACAGRSKNVLKCFAVDPAARNSNAFAGLRRRQYPVKRRLSSFFRGHDVQDEPKCRFSNAASRRFRFFAGFASHDVGYPCRCRRAESIRLPRNSFIHATGVLDRRRLPAPGCLPKLDDGPTGGRFDCKMMSRMA